MRPSTPGRAASEAGAKRQSQPRRSSWRLDWILLAATGALVAYGLWAIAGITRHDVSGNANYYVVRQGVYASLGLLALVVAVFVDPEYYRRYRKQIYVATLGLMVVVLLAGAVTRGSKRWLDLGFFKFQPSEFGKLLLVLFLAGLLADRAKRIGDSKTVLSAIGFAAWSDLSGLHPA